MQLSGNIFVTGGAGFWGRGLMKRARLEDWPCKITVYSRDETKQDVCRQQYPEHRYVLGDITDREHLTIAMAGHDIAIHAGAIKYIPEAEFNVDETIRINVDGSRNVIAAARKAGVDQVIALSTDKACQPVNVYGATKMLMERAIAQAQGPTTYKAVRYGNVVGSTGSVIPYFERQKKELGRITVTDPDMTRFWMSYNDAIDTVLHAIYHGSPNSIIVPRPRSLTMGALANLIADGECAIEYIGQRPGEKTHEDLIHYQESVRVLHKTRDFYELLPIHSGFNGSEPFQVSSLYAERISESEMATMISEAANV